MHETRLNVLFFLVLLGLIFLPEPLHAQKPVISIIALQSPPNSGEELPSFGIVPHIVTEAYRITGYDVKFTFLNLPRALEKVQAGEYDAVLPLWYKKGREDIVAYSKAISILHLGCFALKKREIRIHNKDDLLKYTIGVLITSDAKGYLSEIGAKIEYVPTLSQNVKKLYYGRIDLWYTERIVGAYLIQKLFPENSSEFEWIVTVEKVTQHVGFSRNTPDYQIKMAAFNEGLDALIKTGRIEEIKKEHGVDAQHLPQDKNTFVK